jgi:hypothetical protein
MLQVPAHPSNPELVFQGAYECVPLTRYGHGKGDFTCSAETRANTKSEVMCKCTKLGSIAVVPVYSPRVTTATFTPQTTPASSSSGGGSGTGAYTNGSAAGLENNSTTVATSVGMQDTTAAQVQASLATSAPVILQTTPTPIKFRQIGFETEGVGEPDVGYQGYVILKMTVPDGESFCACSKHTCMYVCIQASRLRHPDDGRALW